jgi:hypothetical protein
MKVSNNVIIDFGCRTSSEKNYELEHATHQKNVSLQVFVEGKTI